MKVTIKNCPADPDGLAGWAAAICTNSSNPERSFDNAVAGGHFSVLEHASFTFEIEDVSRALLAQLTRHRIASFSVQSQRYISLTDGFKFVIPPRIEALRPSAKAEFEYQMSVIQGWYNDWHNELMEAGYKKGEANEDARFVLPNAASTDLACTMNARELLLFFSLRCCNRAQWEIREMAWEMLKACKAVAPKLFMLAGPGCIRGKCPEGKLSCKNPYWTVCAK